MNQLDKIKPIASPRPIFKKSLLAMCIIAASSHGQVFAAEAAPAEEPEVVVVTGIRASLQSAQDYKKQAATVKDVITSNDIGALPDKSVVEALQRLPGVAIERFEASNDPDHFSVEGGKVVVRGLNRVRSEFNGGDAFSARGDGGLGFGDIPPEMVGRVEVSKSQSSDLVEGGVAGTINLVTRKPFDSDEMVIAANIKASYGDLIEEVTPSYSAIFSDTWSTDIGKLGALISIAKSEFSSRGDGVGIYNYYPENSTGITGYKDKSVILPPSASVRQQLNNRDRTGIVGSLQWESPSEALLATVDFIRSDSTVAWNERFVEYGEQPFLRSAKNRDPLDTSKPSSFDCPEGASSLAHPCVFRSGTLKSDGYYVAGTRSREDTRDIDDLTFNLQYKVSDNLKLTGDVQYVKASNEVTDFQASGKFNAITTLDLSDNNSPSVEFSPLPGQQLDGASTYFLRSAMDHKSDNDGDSLAFKFDADYTFEDSFFTSAKAGVRASHKDMDIRETVYNWGSISEDWTTPKSISYTALPKGYVEPYNFGKFLGGSALQTNSTFWMPTQNALSNSESFYTGLGTIGGDWVPLARRTVGTSGEAAIAGTPFLPSEIYNIQEDRKAIYGRIDFADDNAAFKYSGNLGLRFVSWQIESTGADKFPKLPDGPFVQPWDNAGLLDIEARTRPETANAIKFSNRAAGPTTTVKGEEFTKLLPSMNLKMEITDDLIGRFAASQSMFMPDLLNVRNKTNMSTEYTATPVNGTPTAARFESIQSTNAGNPNLQPETAVNLDLALEWYFADVGSLTSTVFHKEISDFFRSATTTQNIYNPVSKITMPVAVMKTENAGDATIDGAELALQTTFGFLGDNFTSFGLQASYTYINDKIKNEPPRVVIGENASYGIFSGLPLEGLSQDNYNLVLFYDNETFQARTAYSWRSDYLLNSRDVIAFAPVYAAGGGQLDASLSYKISDTYKVGLEANNLLDQVTKTSIQYNQEGVQTPRSYFVNDKRYALYVQAKF